MIRPLIMCFLIGALVATAWPGDKVGDDPAATLETARSLAQHNRYSEALTLLTPFVRDDLSDRVSWEIAAEAGRAAFHMGHYRQANELLRKVVQARPVVLEPAIYLEATSYLLGDHVQAFSIFEAILQGGVQDLYLAVTLPGEDRFLAEPEVQSLLARHAQPLVIRPNSGTVQGLHLGQGRSEIASILRLESPDGKSDLVARSGPFMTWMFSFDEDDHLTEVVLNTGHLDRYTPYTLDLSEGISWRSNPITCIGSLGGAQRSATTDDGALILTWDFPETSLDLVFSQPRNNANGAAVLEIIRLYLPTKPQG